MSEGRSRPIRGRPRFPQGSSSPSIIREGSSSGTSTENQEPAMRGRGGLARTNQLITELPTTTTGTGGTDISLISNYFKLIIPKNKVIYRYRVNFDPDVESPRVRRGLIYSRADIFENAYTFDGMYDIKSCIHISTPRKIETTLDYDNSLIQITFTEVRPLSYGSYEMLKLYNTQMRRNLQHTGLTLIGRYYYEPKAAAKLPEHGGVDIYRGYFTAINQHKGGLFMVSDTIFKFVRNETARDACRPFVRKSKDWHQIIKKVLVGQIVITKYNKKTYKIDDVDFSQSPKSTFERKGQVVSFIDYYFTQHRLNIMDQNQPLLLCLPTEKNRRVPNSAQTVLLIPELCYLTGLTDKMKSDHNFMKTVAETTKIGPEARIRQLDGFIRKINSNKRVQQEMGEWDLSLGDAFVVVKGRVLGEELLMGSEEGEPIVNGDFQRQIRGRTFSSTVTFQRWCLLAMKKDKEKAIRLKNTLQSVAEPMGIHIADPKYLEVNDDSTQSYKDSLASVPMGAELVVVLVPNTNKARYDAIKRICCVDRPVPSQVVTTKSCNKTEPFMSLATKIAIQVACKAGAQPWHLDIPPQNIMIAGFDTYHDSKVKGRSAGGFVCTTNATLSSYYSKVTFHSNREEMSSNLGLCVAHGIKAYKVANNTLPDCVIVYRDGVSEGMIPYVFENEVVRVKSGIKAISEGKKIGLSFIIVTKRVNARFFVEKPARQLLNPPPGTVADTKVTRRDRYDFYLISQSVNQGTVSPTMYDIVFDETNWPPENHQKLAYKLTHLYYNWAGTVKVPAPCQYAHKLAFLSGQSLHTEPSKKLESLLWFL